MPDILVIDDDDLIRETLSTFFLREGYSVQVAGDGAEGLTLFGKEPARLVVVDIAMPEKEGIETIMELRRTETDVKIVAISGGGRTGTDLYLDAARKLGADEILAKPFSRAQIVNLAREWLGNRK